MIYEKMRFFLPTALVLALTGCGGLDGTKAFLFLEEVREKGTEIESKTFQAGADALDKYCLSVPESVRLYARHGLNSRTQFAEIEVRCGVAE